MISETALQPSFSIVRLQAGGEAQSCEVQIQRRLYSAIPYFPAHSQRPRRKPVSWKTCSAKNPMAAGDGSSNLSSAGLSFSHWASRPWFSSTTPRALETIPEHAGGGFIASTVFDDQEGQELDNLDGAGQLRFKRISSGLVEPISAAESERNSYWHESPLGSHPPHNPFQSPPSHFVINFGNHAWPRAAEIYCNSRQQQRSPGRHYSGRYVPVGINWCSGRRLLARYSWKRRTTYVVAGTVLLALFFYGLYMAVPKKQQELEH